MTEIIAGLPVQNLETNTLYQIPLNKILVQVIVIPKTAIRKIDSSTNGSGSDQNLFISMSESDSENGDIAIARPK